MAESPLYELAVPALFENLALIGEFIVSVARRAGLDDKSVFNVQLACDEACTNIIEHAYADESGPIRISCVLGDDSLEIRIHDTGRPFDPAAVQKPDLDAPLDRREAGGLGLYFMRSVMDDVRFEFDESGNRLTMVKHFTVPTCEVPAVSGS